MNNPTKQDIYRFTISTMHLLHSEGFFVNSLEEAFYCIKGMVDKQVAEVGRVN